MPLLNRRETIAAFLIGLCGWLPILLFAGVVFAADSPGDVVTEWGVGVGSFGLASGVVWWILKVHLPAKDAQLKEFCDTKDQQFFRGTARG